MSISLSIFETKRLLRQKMRPLRDSLSPEERRERSRRIFSGLESLPLYREAGLVLYYASFGSEVDTWEMMDHSLRSGKRIALPRVEETSLGMVAFEVKDLDRDLQPGYRGIREPQAEGTRPVKAEELRLVVAPGLAFDERGYRLGYGKGYYDRFLASLSLRVPSVGLAYDLQIVEALPVSSRDFPLDFIVTDQRIIFGAKAAIST